MADGAEALRAAASVGPYFAVAQDGPRAGRWHLLAELVGDAALLRSRVAVVRSALASSCRTAPAAVDWRAAGSTHQMALATRLVAPTLATAVLAGVVPALTPGTVRWRAVRSGPIPVAFDGPPSLTADRPGELAGLIDTAVVQPVLAPLVDAFHATFRLSRKVLWGNVASAVNGASTVLAAVRPESANRARQVTEHLLARPRLADHGRYVRPGPEAADPVFVRHSCCLFHLVPGGGICADCVLSGSARAAFGDAQRRGPGP